MRILGNLIIKRKIFYNLAQEAVAYSWQILLKTLICFYLIRFLKGTKFSRNLALINSIIFSPHSKTFPITGSKEPSNESNETDETVDFDSSHESVFAEFAQACNLPSFNFSQNILHPQFLVDNAKPPPTIECFYNNKTIYTDLSNLNAKDVSKNFLLELIEKAEKKNVEALVISISKLTPDYSNYD